MKITNFSIFFMKTYMSADSFQTCSWTYYTALMQLASVAGKLSTIYLSTVYMILMIVEGMEIYPYHPVSYLHEFC